MRNAVHCDGFRDVGKFDTWLDSLGARPHMSGSGAGLASIRLKRVAQRPTERAAASHEARAFRRQADTPVHTGMPLTHRGRRILAPWRHRQESNLRPSA